MHIPGGTAVRRVGLNVKSFYGHVRNTLYLSPIMLLVAVALLFTNIIYAIGDTRE